MWQDKLKEIIYILEHSDVNEIEVRFWGKTYRVVKAAVPDESVTPAVSLKSPFQPRLRILVHSQIDDEDFDQYLLRQEI